MDQRPNNRFSEKTRRNSGEKAWMLTNFDDFDRCRFTSSNDFVPTKL